MTYLSLKECCLDLERNGMLIRLKEPLDPNLIIPEIHRRVYASKGPALFFENIIGTKFPAVSNLFGTTKRSEYLFKDVLKKLEWLIQIKMDPMQLVKSPIQSLKNSSFLISALPKKLNKNTLNQNCLISDLPHIKSWPLDGGSFVTLPQVISFPPDQMNPKMANVGMYRIQLDGNDYKQNEEIGLHYQLHRGIGIHHLEYLRRNKDFRISIGIGGPPANTLASIFPLPEGLSEILFTGLLNNRRYHYSVSDGNFIPQDVDFCITGLVNTKTLKSEGPFGDHLGYYSLAHPFPFLEQVKVYHKKDAIWQFTVVGRPPQEDSSFGHLIHQMVSSLTSFEFPGIKQLHAVDAAGVHPLLLAVGSERYMPFRSRKPEEILTSANLLLGKGQTSLAKYLFIAAEEVNGTLDVKNIPSFFNYILERIDWRFDLHFYTNTTIDTLDYSGSDWNAGSKVVIACNRDKLRELDRDLTKFQNLPDSFSNVRFIQNGIVAIQGPGFESYRQSENQLKELIDYLTPERFQNFPLIVICDDSNFLASDFSNFIWTTFTRSNPSHDIYGVQSKVQFKHWSCGHSLIIDARTKPHHAPVLEPDPDAVKKVDDIVFKNPVLKKIIQ
jgi:4-hydroxy-3-polyprenylbenzoate decarboxylase